MKFATNLINDKKFFTDSNGLEEQKRIINYRSTWNLTVNEEVSGNFYPVTSHIGLEDSSTNKSFVILTDRSQGGSVLKDGEIQLMIHRRLLYDDDRGVGESLNEIESDGSGLKQRVRHYVVFGGNYRQVQVQNDQKVRIVLG